MDDYTNSVSQKNDPYVKLKKCGKIIALTVKMRQCKRTVLYESITDNATLNYPVIDVLDRMKQIDSNFAREYEEGTDNVFYKSNW